MSFFSCLVLTGAMACAPRTTTCLPPTAREARREGTATLPAQLSCCAHARLASSDAITA